MTAAQRRQWHRERDLRRTCHMQISGRHTSKYGNYLCRYNPDTGELNLDLQMGAVYTLCLKNVVFPYRGDLLKNNFHASRKDRKSVGFTIDLKYDGIGRPYVLVKAAITLDRHMCPFSSRNGVISVDLNWDHIAWCDLNGDGNLIRHGTVPLPLTGKTTRQNRDIIGRSVAEIIGICQKAGKPLVMEDLDFTQKKAQMEYGSRDGNRKLSMFAYQHLTQGLLNRAEDNGVSVKLINPAYTSFIGKVKYMKHMRTPVHNAAAYVIGRRGMNLKERIPTYLQKAKGRSRDSMTIWRRLYKVCEDMFQSGHFARRLPNFKNQKALVEYVKAQTA